MLDYKSSCLATANWWLRLDSGYVNNHTYREAGWPKSQLNEALLVRQNQNPQGYYRYIRTILSAVVEIQSERLINNANDVLAHPRKDGSVRWIVDQERNGKWRRPGALF